MKNIWKYIIPAILGAIIGGLLTYLTFQPLPPIPIQQPPETPLIEPKPVKPDTIRITRYISVPSKLPTSSPLLPDDVTVVIGLDDEIEGVPGLLYYESEISYYYGADLNHNPKLKEDGSWLAKTTTWAYGIAPVDSFKQMPVIRWNHYYDKYVSPTHEFQLKKAKHTNLFKGIAAGALTVAGLAYGEWYTAVPAMVGSVFIVFYF